MFWDKYSRDKIREVISLAFDKNLNYHTDIVLGFPGTHLDPEAYYSDECSVLIESTWESEEVTRSPFLRALIENPNHIGCHTLTQAEEAFAGTQELEVEAIRLCAEQIMNGSPLGQDGYVAPGGTEANIEALWIYRNQLCRQGALSPSDIGVLFSSDTHYSIHKGINLLSLRCMQVPVDEESRAMNPHAIEAVIAEAVASGVRAFIVVLNMSTTMFGSVDDPYPVTNLLKRSGLPFRLHVDGAYGGFVYPFTCPDHALDFRNPDVSSIAMDAHKMLKAPYGTGLFLVRKGLMESVCTEEARYVHGKDYTLCGSRSGANAIAIWMLLRDFGSEGIHLRAKRLVERTDNFCRRLDERKIRYFRNPFINIVAIKAEFIPPKVAAKYNLVPDSHEGLPAWWKIVVMDHVRPLILDLFLEDLT